MTEVTIQTYPGPLAPFARAIGSRTAKIALVGEALGEQEDMTGAPFSGSSGQELNRMLAEVGLARRDCFLTNVFSFRPQRNNMDVLCVRRAEVGQGYPMPLYSQGKYIHPQFLPELDRLYTELESVRPNLIIALGNTACWALLYRSAISSVRGSITAAVRPAGAKVLPTYHPAAVMRNWSLRPIVLVDLLKAAREQDFPEIRRPERELLVAPTYSEAQDWVSREVLAHPGRTLACDIETSRGQITMVGFASSSKSALVIPFVNPVEPSYSYWDTPARELEAWQIVRLLLEDPRWPKLFQNGVYDLQYLLKMGFHPRNCLHDTMLLHHSLFPELQKGLGFLGSIYTNEQNWKLMRGQAVGTKKDE